MATCPNCKGEMSMTDTICLHCGYDFPPEEFDENRKRKGIAYSSLADLALAIGMACSALSAVLMLILGVIALVGLNFLAAFSSVISFFILLALYVVFQRVADMD